MLPLLVSTPHCADQVPYWIMARMLESGEAEPDLRRRLLREGDPYTDLLFHLPEAQVTVNAPASRFVADLNRDRDETGENGVIKLTDFDRRSFYAPGFLLAPEAAELRLMLYYDPYHRALDRALMGGGIRFFIDGHSMTSQGPAIGPDQGRPRPAICLGNFGDANGDPVSGPVSCAPETARAIRDHLEGLLVGLLAEPGAPQGVVLNQPFDGGHILKRYSQAPYAVPGLMIEVNRGLYLDEETLLPLPGRVEALRAAMQKLAVFIIGRAARP
jgi:N-formylglutamate deformylase